MFYVQAGFLMNIVCLVTVALSINTYAVPLFDLNRSKSEIAVFIVIIKLL